jgi:thiol-disulfide isomerase/thioredoxin
MSELKQAAPSEPLLGSRIVLGLGALALVALVGGIAYGKRSPAPPTPLSQVSTNPYLEGQSLTQPESNHPLVRRQGIDFKGKTLDGRDMNLSDYLGRPVMINFWATWCGPCRFEMPILQRVYEKRQAEGLEILAVNAGERVPADQVVPTVQAFVDEMGLTFPVIFPEDTFQLQQEYTVYGLPSSFLIGPDGVVANAHTGVFISADMLNDWLAPGMLQAQPQGG